MVNGIGIIRDSFQNFFGSLNNAARRLLFRMVGGSDGQLLVRLDDEACRLLADFSAKRQLTLEEAAVCWLELRANAFREDLEVADKWAALSPREQQVVALCCFEYSDPEIAAALGIAYGTARTHIYKAIDKLGIRKKAELQFLLRNWDFSKFDRNF